MDARFSSRLLTRLAATAIVFSANSFAAPPCALLSSAQISSALGITVGAGAPIATTGCSWSGPGYITTVSMVDASRWSRMKSALPGATYTPVAGLGDDAFFTVLQAQTGAGFVTLSVKKGGTAYLFKVYSKLRSIQEQMSIEKALAADAAPNL